MARHPALVLFAAGLAAATAADPGTEGRCPAGSPGGAPGDAEGPEDASYVQTRALPRGGGLPGAVGLLARASYPMCAKARQTCDFLSTRADGRVGIAAVRQVLQAPGAFAGFLKLAMVKVEDGNVTCEHLCQASVDYLERQGTKMPEAPDLGCYSSGDEVKCDFDLSPSKILEMFADHPQDIPHAPAMAASLLDTGAGPSKRGAAPPQVQYTSAENPFKRELTNNVNEVALRILYMLRVYPKDWVTYWPASGLEHKPEGKDEAWVTIVAKNNLVSRAYLNAAILRVVASSSVDAAIIDKWFGESASQNPAVRSELLRIMSAVMQVVNSAAILYTPTMPSCSVGTYAFVVPRGSTGVPDADVDEDPSIRQSPQGTMVVNLCEFYFDYPGSHGLWESVQTFIHESSHHDDSYLRDVFLCEEYTYLNLETAKLADLPQTGGHRAVTDDSVNVFLGRDLLSAVNQSLSGPSDQIDGAEQYVVQMLRFSQDGAYMLAGVYEASNSTDAPYYPEACIFEDGQPNFAYGPDDCQQIAREQPFKALLSADSFGYFIVDVAERFFKAEAEALS